MLVQLKSNKSQHEIPSKDWEKLTRDQKSNYTVIEKTDTVITTQVAENIVSKKAEDKKEAPSKG